MKIISDNSLYFYGYPGSALKDKNETDPFYNDVPFHTVERKVASRLGTMGVDYINFSSNTDLRTERIYDLFQFDLDKQHTFSREAEIFDTLLEKDQRIKYELLHNFPGKKIYQAQGYSDNALEAIYDASSVESLKLNDKLYMPNRIPQKFMLPRFVQAPQQYPFVAKLSRSSAGDATDIIKNQADLEAFQQKFKDISDTVPLYYELFKQGKEYGIEFYRDIDGNFDIITMIESIVDENNSYAGGLISPQGKDKITPQMQELIDAVQQHLEKIDRHGRGGIDIIEDTQGDIYAIDPNIRMTQIMPGAWDMYRNKYDESMCYGSFTVDTSQEDRTQNLKKAVNSGIMKGYSGTIYKDTFYGDGSILFDQHETLRENKKGLGQLGVLFD